MRNRILVAGIAAAALIPTFAMAQQTCEQRSANRTTGTIVGAGIGALLGSAVAGSGHKGDGAIVGGIGGAIVGNQASMGARDCQHAYGYYDNNNTWHPTQVARENARGYYDRNGNWVDGAPSGAWDRDGRWVVYAPSAVSNGAYASYTDTPRDIRAREDWLDQRIRRGAEDGSLDRREARDAQRSLDQIRAQERNLSRNGRLSNRNQDYIMAKLDDLSRQVRDDRRDDARNDDGRRDDGRRDDGRQYDDRRN